MRSAKRSGKSTSFATCSRDVVAEEAALSLARRRGKCTPTVDTKLANAWLGFYVALTKSSSRPIEAATQASTEAATETSFSDGASSVTEEPLTGDMRRESWADASEITEEQGTGPKKRARRSHRRRRTRGRGKKGRGKQTGEDPEEEECSVIGEEEDNILAIPSTPTYDSVSCATASPPCHAQRTTASLAGNSFVNSMTVTHEAPKQWPFQTSRAADMCTIEAVLPTGPLPMLSPSKARAGPTGLLASTSPNAAVYTSPLQEASARAPPKVAFAGSPVACNLSSTPVVFGSPIYQGGHASYQGSHMVVTSPGGMCIGQSAPPTFFVTNIPSPPVYVPVSPNLCPTHMTANPTPSPVADAVRSWLGGGVPTSDAELAMRLQAAVPEVYED